MNKIIMVGGGKGGVGKSAVTIGVVDLLLTKGEQVVLVETDDSNPDTYKPLIKIIPCEICNLDREEGFIKLAGVVENNKSAVIVVNTAARNTEGIIMHGGILTDTCAEMKRELVMLWVIGRARDCVELLADFLDSKQAYTSTHAVLNTYFGAVDKFARFHNSEYKKEVNGVVVFPELNDLVADKINDNRFALSNATGLSIAERSVLGRYRNAIAETFKGVV